MKNLLLLSIVLLVSASVNAQDSLDVTKIGQLYSNWGWTADIAVSGDFAYISTYITGLRVLDVTDISNPFEVGFYSARDIGSIAIQGNNCYALTQGTEPTSEGLLILDITDPSNPSEVTFYDMPGGIWLSSLAISGDHAFVDGSTSESNTFYVIDVSSLDSLYVKGTCPLSKSVGDIEVYGNYAYLSMGSPFVDTTDFFGVIDISDLAHPQLVDSCEVDWVGMGGAIAIYGQYAYIAGGFSGLNIVNISEPTQLFVEGINDSLIAGEISISDSGNFSYVTNGYNGLQIVDISDPPNTVLRGYCEVQSEMPGLGGIVVSGDYSYISLWQPPGLAVVNVYDPDSPFVISRFNTLGWINGVALSGDYAYLAASWSGLRVVDISNPVNPSEIGFCDTPDWAMDITVAGDYAYVADYEGGLRIMDVSNIGYPIETSYCNIPKAQDIAISGNYVCVACDTFGLYIVDVSNPQNPDTVSHYDTTMVENPISTGAAWGVAASENYAYIAEYGLGLLIVSIPDAALSGVYPTWQGLVWGVDVAGDYAYLTDSQKGLRIIDVSNPSAPFETDSVSLYSYSGAKDVAVSGDTAWVVDFFWGIHVIDVSNPYDALVIGYYNTPGDPQDIAASGNYGFVADFNFFGIYYCGSDPVEPHSIRSVPLTYSLSLPFPNPFNSTTTISFSLPAPLPVKLVVYDATGRDISTLFDGRGHGGVNHILFDGTGLASGIYFLRLEAGNYKKTQKLVLMK